MVKGFEDAEAPARGDDLPARGRGGVALVHAERDETEVMELVLVSWGFGRAAKMPSPPPKAAGGDAVAICEGIDVESAGGQFVEEAGPLGGRAATRAGKPPRRTTGRR